VAEHIAIKVDHTALKLCLGKALSSRFDQPTTGIGDDQLDAPAGPDFSGMR
jgi:hypothetical protein